MAADRVENAWRNVSFSPAQVRQPETVEDVVAIVKEAKASGRRVKAIGGGHSMNHIFRTDGVLVDLRRLNRVCRVDPQAGTAEVEAGLTIGDAIGRFAEHGLHFPSLGSWYSQTLAGAIATATHGSSLTHGSLSDTVVAVEAVLADGTVRTFSDGDELRAWRCHLGRLGLVTKVTLRLAPAFWLSCAVTTEPARAAFDRIVATARASEYASLLWLPDLDEACTRILKRTGALARNQAAIDLERRFTRRGRLSLRLEDVGIFALGHLYQLMPRALSKWYGGIVKKAFFDDDGVVDKSYRVFLYDQYREPTENHRLRMIMNAEYAFDLDRLAPLLHRLREQLISQRSAGRYLHYPRLHVRFAPRRDETLIGLNADRDTAYVGFYVVGSIRSRRQIPIAEEIEDTFIAFGGRPHWGKYRYRTDRRYEAEYPGLAAFQATRAALDPEGLFSEATDMFAGLNRFERAPLGAMFRSVFDPDEYQPIRLL